MGFIDAIKSGFSNSANFEGRARRSEYWFWFLFIFLCTFGLVFIDLASGMYNTSGYGLLSTIFWFAICIPQIAVSVRRLHDSGKSGWWIVIGFVPLLGVIVLLIFYVLDSQPGANIYGPNPKGVEAVTLAAKDLT
jgi:uncharacterized membrane protein YhaH (DUF805 family)